MRHGKLLPSSLLLACWILLLACSSLLLTACGPSGDGTDEVPSESAWFEEVATSSGLDFVHQWGHEDVLWMPEIMAGGAALFDMDDDGDLDAYLVQGGYVLPTEGTQAMPGNQLYRNRGDGTFENVTAEAGDAGDTGYGMGAATGDVDGDGRVDLYLTNLGRDTLLRNLGDGRFEDVTEQAGLGNTAWGAGAVFFDMDRDGDLDLMVSNYLDWSTSREIDCYGPNGRQVYCSPQSYDAPIADLLYRNEGDGTFTDVSEESGLAARLGTGLGVVSSDFNGDGWPDLFVANDGMPDHLWLNQQDGTFREDAAFAGCALDQDGHPKAGMGVTVADIDEDGDQDLLVCNLRQESDSLYRNDGGGLFSDVTIAYGLATVSEPFTRFGIGWIDFDQDGQLDLYQANGRVTHHSAPLDPNDVHAEPNLLFRGLPPSGDDVGGFVEVLPRGGTASELVATSRAAAFGDVDGDGAVDILVVNTNAPPHLLRNVVPERGGWMAFDLRDSNGAPALGARLEVRVGERQVVREMRSTYSYFAANDPRVHIGLGEAERVEGVRVQWADGSTSEHGDFEAGQVVRLDQGN